MLNNDPVRTGTADRWRVTFSEELPQGPWRDKFLSRAQLTSEGRALGLNFEGRTLGFNCPDFEDRETLKVALQSRIRFINELLELTKPGRAPGQ